MEFFQEQDRARRKTLLRAVADTLDCPMPPLIGVIE